MDDQSHYSNSEDINRLLASLNQEEATPAPQTTTVGVEAVQVKDSMEVPMNSSLEARLRELD